MSTEEQLQPYRGGEEVALLNAQIRAAEKPAPVRVASEAEIQARADRMAIDIVRDRAKPVFAEYGRPLPAIDSDETILAYRKRLARALQPETDNFVRKDYRSTPADLFVADEQKIYKEAEKNRWNPSDRKPGKMRPVVKIDHAGRRVTEYVTGRGSKGFFKEIYGAFTAPGVISAIHQFDAD